MVKITARPGAEGEGRVPLARQVAERVDGHHPGRPAGVLCGCRPDELQDLGAEPAPEFRGVAPEQQPGEAFGAGPLHARTFFARAALSSIETRAVSAWSTFEPRREIR